MKLASGQTLLLLAAATLAAAYALRKPARPEEGHIRRIPVPQEDLFVFEVEGRIGREDIEDMAEQVLDGFDRLGQINILINMPRFRGMGRGAGLDPTGLLAQARSLGHVGRYAVVGPPAWAGAVITAMDKVIPVQARTFDAKDLDRAYDWARAGSLG